MSDLRALQQQLADTPLAPFDVHQHVGQFLAREAWLLDRRLFERWVDLFTDDGIYWVPSGREDGDPGIDAVIVYESKRELRAHVSRLRHPLAITEQPPPRVRHVLGPVLAWQTSEGLVASVNMLVEVHWAANRR
ncbi:MAG: nuclear transport factor 2 family protein [Chloroflexi bacterium]|nr:nuclear transport factor 2 family protein [Chloroflexota bacterium]